MSIILACQVRSGDSLPGNGLSSERQLVLAIHEDTLTGSVTITTSQGSFTLGAMEPITFPRRPDGRPPVDYVRQLLERGPSAAPRLVDLAVGDKLPPQRIPVGVRVVVHNPEHQRPTRAPQAQATDWLDPRLYPTWWDDLDQQEQDYELSSFIETCSSISQRVYSITPIGHSGDNSYWLTTRDWRGSNRFVISDSYTPLIFPIVKDPGIKQAAAVTPAESYGPYRNDIHEVYFLSHPHGKGRWAPGIQAYTIDGSGEMRPPGTQADWRRHGWTYGGSLTGRHPKDPGVPQYRTSDA